MKRRIILLVAAIMAFGLAFAVYAINSGDRADSSSAMVSCCKGDLCPMKTKKAGADEKAADDCACCKDGSCPMKKGEGVNGEKGCCKMKGAHSDGKAMKHAEGESCPMMKSSPQGEHKMSAGHEHKDGHAGCGCPCCGKDKETKKDPTV